METMWTETVVIFYPCYTKVFDVIIKMFSCNTKVTIVFTGLSSMYFFHIFTSYMNNFVKS